MKKAVMLLFSLAAFVAAAHAQSNQELLEAYRNGTLTQSQIDDLKAKGAAGSKGVNSAQKNRRRSVNTATANGVNDGHGVVNADELTNMPADPGQGLLEEAGQSSRPHRPPGARVLLCPPRE